MNRCNDIHSDTTSTQLATRDQNSQPDSRANHFSLRVVCWMTGIRMFNFNRLLL